MANATFWTNTKIDLQTALGAAQTITGITNANPAVVTTSGTLPTDGAYVLLTVTGMTEVSSRVYRVDGAAGSTFELEGCDSTLFGTFGAGSFQVITFGTSMTTVRGINPSGGDYEYTDLTTIHVDQRVEAPTVAQAAGYNFECLFDPADAAHVELGKANDTKTQRAFLVTWANGKKMTMFGYVGSSGLPGGEAQGLVNTQVSVRMQSRPVFYAT